MENIPLRGASRSAAANIIQIIKSRRTREWETGEVHTGFWGEDLSKTDHLEYPEDKTTLDIQEVGFN